MEMTVKYYSKQVYGKTLFYLVTDNKEQDLPAICLLALIRAKTIQPREMELCEALGVTFERVFEPVN